MKIFYDPRMCADVASFSRSSAKPRHFFAAAMCDHAGAVTQEGFEPVSLDDFRAAHDPAHVDAVWSLQTANGFGTADAALNESLRWTSGSMVAAALEAARTRDICCSPTSGFHHAGRAYSEGYCTFNGLVLAAQAVRAEQPDARVVILDCDMHYGDGTEDIRQALGLDWLTHLTAGRDFQEDARERDFMRWLDDSIRRINQAAPAVVLYQAGADAHVDDPLGGYLSTAGMAHRDAQVFCDLDADIGIAWNLAGGYQKRVGDTNPVIELHLETLRQALNARRSRALCQWRRAIGWSTTALADALDVAEAAIQRWEAGDLSPHALGPLQALATRLGRPLALD